MTSDKLRPEEPRAQNSRGQEFHAPCPTLLVIGSRGIGSVARAANDLLRSHGLRVGLSLSQAAFVDRERVQKGTASLARFHRNLLRHQDLNALIIAASIRRAMERSLGMKTITAASLWGDIDVECSVQPALAFADAFRTQLIVTSGSRIDRALARDFAGKRLVLIGCAPRASAVEAHIARGGSGLLCRWSADGREPHSAEFYLEGTLVVRSPLPDLRLEQSLRTEARLHAFALAHLALVADVRARTYH